MTCQLLNGGQGDSYLDRTGAEGVPERVLDHTGKPGSPHGGNEYPPIECASVPGFACVHRGGEHPGGDNDLSGLQSPENGKGDIVQRHMPGLSGLGQRDCENP